MKNIFLFDKNKCVGCGACKIACINENGFQNPDQWRNIYTSNENRNPDLALIHMSLACNHCDDSPCLVNCPAKAYTRDEITKAVIHNSEKCIGCKYCTWTCPFDAPKYNPKEGIVSKCTFCVDRLKDNQKPACANLCPTGALSFATQEFSREESEESAPLPVNVGSNIKIIELRNPNPPIMDKDDLAVDHKENKSTIGKKISAFEEWPLLVFTFIIAVLNGILTEETLDTNSVTMKIGIISLFGIGSVFSLMHLGKKERSWRAILNIKDSWLSKEIFFFSTLMGLLFLNYFLMDIPEWVISFNGILLLISIDMLYLHCNYGWPVKLHYGNTIIISILVFGIFQQSLILVSILLLIKIVLMILFAKHFSINYTVKIILKILLITGAFYLTTNDFTILGLSIAVFSELSDRIDFYNHLRLPDVKEFS